MKVTAIFVLFCIIVGCYSTNFAEIEQLEKTSFGKSLLDTIQIQLESKAPVQQLLDMLSNMGKQLKTDQENADAAHEKFQAACTKDIKYYVAEIADSRRQIKEQTDNLATYRPALKADQEALVKEQANLANLQGQLLALNNQRAEEAAEYELKVQEHQTALLAIAQAKKLFSTLKASSFLQSHTTVFAQVQSHFSSTVSEMRSEGNKALFTLLASIASKAPVQADQSLVGKILGLCDKITANLNESFQKEERAENERIKVYNAAKKALESDISTSEAEINRLELSIATLTTQIATSEKILEEQKDRLKVRSAELVSRTKECNAEDAAYKAEKAKRDQERDTVKQAYTLIDRRLGNLSDYISKRIENVE